MKGPNPPRMKDYNRTALRRERERERERERGGVF
jgi:hypothetical protein